MPYDPTQRPNLQGAFGGGPLPQQRQGMTGDPAGAMNRGAPATPMGMPTWGRGPMPGGPGMAPPAPPPFTPQVAGGNQLPPQMQAMIAALLQNRGAPQPPMPMGPIGTQGAPPMQPLAQSNMPPPMPQGIPQGAPGGMQPLAQQAFAPGQMFGNPWVGGSSTPATPEQVTMLLRALTGR